MRLGGKHCPGVKCNPHGVDILFFYVLWLLCHAYRLGYLEHIHNYCFTKRRRSAAIAFLGGPHETYLPLPQNRPWNRSSRPIKSIVWRWSRVESTGQWKVESIDRVDRQLSWIDRVARLDRFRGLPQNPLKPHFGGPFNTNKTYHIESTVIEPRSWNFTVTDVTSVVFWK